MGSDKLGRSKDGSKVKYSAGGRVGGVGPGAGAGGGGGVGAGGGEDAGGVPGVVPGCAGVEAGVDPGLVVEFGLVPGVVDAGDPSGDKPPLMLCELEAAPAKVEAPGKCPFAE